MLTIPNTSHGHPFDVLKCVLAVDSNTVYEGGDTYFQRKANGRIGFYAVYELIRKGVIGFKGNIYVCIANLRTHA